MNSKPKASITQVYNALWTHLDYISGDNRHLCHFILYMRNDGGIRIHDLKRLGLHNCDFMTSRQNIKDIMRGVNIDIGLYITLTGMGLSIGSALMASLEYG